MDLIRDPNFNHSVVLTLEHDEQEGAVGLVVNRETDLTLAKLYESLDMKWDGALATCVGWGGPVAPETGWVLLGDEAATGLDVTTLRPGLSWSRSQDALRRAAASPTLPSRVCLGYAGWTAGQLEREIAMGGWLVAPAEAALVFEPDIGRIWEGALRLLGIDPATLIPAPAPGVN